MGAGIAQVVAASGRRVSLYDAAPGAVERGLQSIERSLMKLAEKFGLPLFTFIDTPGAFPGIGAEERGQSEAIGRNLYEMAGLETPIPYAQHLEKTVVPQIEDIVRVAKELVS